MSVYNNGSYSWKNDSLKKKHNLGGYTFASGGRRGDVCPDLKDPLRKRTYDGVAEFCTRYYLCDVDGVPAVQNWQQRLNIAVKCKIADLPHVADFPYMYSLSASPPLSHSSGDQYHKVKAGTVQVWEPLQEDANEITMTLTMRVESASGRFLGVAGADLRVEDTIDSRLAQSVGSSHKAFIVEDDGADYTLVGASVPVSSRLV